jgi:ribulose-phosphate 3-epimerase
VPNLTFGAPLIKALRRFTDAPLDVHLMVMEPERYVAEYADLGVNVFTFHPEATFHVQRHLTEIRDRGMAAGLALNPASPLTLLEDVLADLDLILIMCVNPGFGGQAYLSSSSEKIRRTRALLSRTGTRAALEVDGGITVDTIATAWRAGADTFVAGTAIFGQPDIAGAVRALQHACTERA